MTGVDIYKKLTSYDIPNEHARILSAIVGAESGYNPEAEYITPWEDSVGLFQINMKAHYDKLERWTKSKNPEVWRNWLKNPENNIFAASEVYKSQGLGAWSTYTSGKYIPYLEKLKGIKVPEKKASPVKDDSTIKDTSKPAGAFSGVTVAGGAIILLLALVVGIILLVTGGMRSAQT